MRTEQEMMGLIYSIAEQDERIRIMTLEGSRTNKNIPKDEWQDFDITFFTEEMETFFEQDDWLGQFGKIIMMQNPEDMDLFPATENGYSYLMMLEDYNKIDLTLMPLEYLDDYLDGNGLVEVLMDKDDRVQREVKPTDEAFHVRKPTASEFDDCCNEFWHVTSYVVKGLCRKEILYAIDHLNEILRPELLRMMSWKVGVETSFSLSVGKNHKFINRYMEEETWEKLLGSYNTGSYKQAWKALFTIHELFREASGQVAEMLHFNYPPYDGEMSRFTEDMHRKYMQEEEK